MHVKWKKQQHIVHATLYKSNAKIQSNAAQIIMKNLNDTRLNAFAKQFRFILFYLTRISIAASIAVNSKSNIDYWHLSK